MTTADPTPPRTPAEALTDADLDAIEERAAIAAPSRLRTAMGCIPDGQIRQGCILSDGDTIREAIRAAAKLALKDVPALVAEVRRRRGRIETLESIHDADTDELLRQRTMAGQARAQVADATLSPGTAWIGHAQHDTDSAGTETQ